MNIVFLPATEPDDETYGRIPDRIAVCPGATIRAVHFPTLVWYNAAVRREAIAQIRAMGDEPVTLVGFSKSGLGAWNIARVIPDRVAATVIFDAPMVRLQKPPWGTDPFYADDAAWQMDVPALTIPEFRAAVPAAHRLVLISGANFHDEMVAMAGALTAQGVSPVFLPRPDLRHHWNSGWLEEGLRRAAR